MENVQNKASGTAHLARVANPLLVGRVADATAQRDRDALDSSIVGLLQEFLDARSVDLYRVDDAGTEHRFVKRAAAARDEQLDGASQPEGCRKTFPIEERGTLIGKLEVLCDAPITARDSVLVRGMLRVLRNQLSLLDYGERDTLTGLLNRKTFENHFEKMRRRHSIPTDRGNSHEPSWLALADIDKFKSINDSHGHLFGDEVLLIVSQILKRSFRGGDQLFRFGGEEFLIVLDHATEAGADAALDRFRAAVEAHAFPQIERVTISLGYTRILPHDVPTICSERADDALYFAKRNGRNRLCHYETLVAAGSLKPKSNITEIELF